MDGYFAGHYLRIEQSKGTDIPGWDRIARLPGDATNTGIAAEKMVLLSSNLSVSAKGYTMQRKGLVIVMLLAVAIVGCKKEEPGTTTNTSTAGQTPAGPVSNGTTQAAQGTMVSVDDAEIFEDANDQRPTQIGDKAWDLKTLDYVKGGPLMIEPGTVYVVAFWATSSEPSVSGIGLLTELAQKYKDKKVAVVGISQEDMGVVREFVAGQIDKIGYDIAVDLDGAVYDAYMTAFNQKDLPYAFIVDADGNIAWHGSPTTEMGQEVDKALAVAPVAPPEKEDALPDMLDGVEVEMLPGSVDTPQEKVEQ
jgi:thiol-disulfide isomerase/thioredoxin